MLNCLKNEANKALTENGAATLKTTNSDCLDLFATVGSIRHAGEKEIVNRFVRAFAEDRLLALKLLFFARDIRGGLGERRVFRIILEWLAKNEPAVVRKNLEYVAEYGRFDDLLCLFGTPLEKDMLVFIKKQLEKDTLGLITGGEVSLLAKWLPSVNTSNNNAVLMAKKIARYLGMTDAEYRKSLSKLRAHIRIIENNLREKDYTFDYEKQPSKALFKYRAAFMRNDNERYEDFLKKVSEGEAILNAATLAPYELVDPYLRRDWRYCDVFMRDITEEEKKTLNATWASLPSFETNGNILPIIDTSGSMYDCGKPSPASVALSLGLYLAEHNSGIFKNHFIEFSSEPELIEIKGETFADRLRFVTSFCKVADTNIEAVFDLVLSAAVNNNVPRSELPEKIVIISDMEFNYCVDNAEATNLENAKRKFEAAGYKLPELVFWNVCSRRKNQPVTKNEQGVALISGCTPQLFSSVADGSLEAKTPYEFMLEILYSDRYAHISI